MGRRRGAPGRRGRHHRAPARGSPAHRRRGRAAAARAGAHQAQPRNGRDAGNGRHRLRRCSPEMAMLVPEGRQEITTEGGLDVVGAGSAAEGRGGTAAGAGHPLVGVHRPELAQVEAAARIGARVCEVHTGPYAHAFHAKGRDAEIAGGRRRAGEDPCCRRRDPRARHALQRRATRSTTSTCSRSRRCRACASCTSATRSSRARSSSVCARRCGR